MRGFLGAVFGSSDNTKTIVDGAVAGIDKIIFTEQERSEARAQLSEWYLKYLEATQPQNLARRFIALLVVLLWCLLILVGVASYWISEAFSQFVFNTINTTVNTPFSIIVGFYFAAHLVRALPTKKEQ